MSAGGKDRSGATLLSVVARYVSEDVRFDYEYAFEPPGGGPHYWAAEEGSGEVLVAWLGEDAFTRMLDDVLIERGDLYVAECAHGETPSEINVETAYAPDAAAVARFRAEGAWRLAALSDADWLSLDGHVAWKKTSEGPRPLRADLWNPDEGGRTSSGLNLYDVSDELESPPVGWEAHADWSEWHSRHGWEAPPDPAEHAVDFWMAMREAAGPRRVGGGPCVVAAERRAFRSPGLRRIEATFDNGDTLVLVVSPSGVEISLHGEEGVVAADLHTWLDAVTEGAGAEHLIGLATHGDVALRRQGAELIRACLRADLSLLEQLTVGSLDGSRRTVVARVRKLLGSHALADVKAGVALLAQQPAGDIAALAEGCVVGERGVLSVGPEVDYRCEGIHKTMASAGLARVSGALDGVVRLDLSRDARSGGEVRTKLADVEFLEGATGLRELDLEGSRALTSIAPLREQPALTDLNLVDTRLADFSPLVDMVGLRRLTVGWEFDLRWLPALPQVTELTVKRCSYIDLAALEGMTGLGTLHLEGCDDIDNIETLARLGRLERLNLTRCTGIIERLRADHRGRERIAAVVEGFRART